MKNKAQTAMEYLMTYGWAILIIIVVVAALYSLGVFSVKPSVACSPCFSYFAFRDYDKTGTATCTAGGLYIRNGARTIDTLSSDVGSTSDCPTGSPCDPGQDICPPGQPCKSRPLPGSLHSLQCLLLQSGSFRFAHPP